MAGELPPLLVDLGVILAVAAVTTIVFNRLRQPVVLGYLLAGLIVGPYTPPFSLVREAETIRTLGEIGVVFLLFALGLEFNLRKLRRVGATALISGTLQVALMVWLGYLLGRAFGLPPLGAVFLGAIMSISSTVIIVKVVGEMRQQDAEWAQIVFGILIVEDILAVLMLTALGATGGGAALDGGILGVLVTFFGFILVALLLGLLLVPRLMALVARLGVDEVLIVTALALGVGLAVLGGVLGFSPALGAFVAGALIGESAQHKLVEERMAPLRDLFSAIFFVTVGMLVDPGALREHWALIAAVTLTVIAGKILAGSFATFVTGRDVPTSLRVGFGLAQVGEFSFILASLALALEVTDAPLYAVAVSAAGVTAFTTPLLMRAAGGAARALERRAPASFLSYARLYGAWTKRLRQTEAPADPARRAARRHAGFAAVYLAASIGSLALGGAALQRLPGDALPATTRTLAWAGVIVVAIGFGALSVNAQRGFARSLSEAAIPPARRATEEGASAQRVLQRTFLLGGLVLASALVLLFTSPFLPTLAVLPLVALGVLLAATLLYRAVGRVEDQLERSLASVLAETASDERRALLDELRQKHPWAPGVREVELDATFAPVSLRRLHLRGRTGASVVALGRGGHPILSPAPETTLLPADRVVLVGDEAQLDAAAALLAEGAPAHAALVDADPVEVALPPGSPLAGRTLGELRLTDRAGVTVLAVLREGAPLPGPGSQTRVAEGDLLVVLGSPAQVERFRGLASERTQR